MKIGIEAHTIEKKERLGAGGNYLLNLLKQWSKLDSDKYQFILYFKDRIPSEKFLNSPVFIKKILVGGSLRQSSLRQSKSTALYYNIFMPLTAKLDKVDILFLPFYMRPFFCFTPTITAIHDISFKAHPEWFSWNYKLPFRILARLAVQTSKAILTCSEYTKKEIIKYYPSTSLRASKTPSEKIHVIYLAADSKFNNQKDIEKIKQAKQKYGLKHKYLFYTGNIFNRRHVLETIKAFENLKRTCPEEFEGYQFLISGRDISFPFQNIDEKIKKINFKFPNTIKRVRYMDKNDFFYIYQGAELFVWLSEYEGFGLPVLEAMACGIPVLTTKKTSLKEVIGDYPLWVKNPNDVNEIKEKMYKILTDKNLRKNLIEKGLKQSQKFSWQKTAEETLKIINKYART